MSRTRFLAWRLLLLFWLFWLANAAQVLGGDPISVWSFRFSGALPRWQDGLPVGNGRIGAQSWGTGPELILTLDRSDVWDLRYQPNTSPYYNYAHLRELVRGGHADLIQTQMVPDLSPTADFITPTHLPAGRLRIELPQDTKVQHAELDMEAAEARWELTVGGRPAVYRVFACATEDVIVATLEGRPEVEPKVTFEPLLEIRSVQAALANLETKLHHKVGYEKPEQAREENYSWALQRIPASGQTVTMWRTDVTPNGWELLLTITPQDDPHPVASARRTLDRAHKLGVAQLLAEHRAWWRERWARSAVELPNKKIQRLWINGIYKLASSSTTSVPANLQGLWPADGELSAFRGEYHGDMDVQETYWPAYTSNQLDLAEPLNRWLVEKVGPEAEAHTKRFYGVDGIQMGTMYDAQGRLLGGPSDWWTVQYWVGAGGWFSQFLWWYYHYSLDTEFLRRAYPFMKKCLVFYENYLEKTADGRLHVPLSTSPEYFSNDLKAWTADPTCDLSIIRNLTAYCIRAAKALGVDEAAQKRWEALVSNLAPYPQDEQSGLMVQPNAEYAVTHRHPIHLFPLFPGEDLSIEGTPADQQLIAKSISNWIFRGTGEWWGWSFPYASLIASRVRRGNHAEQLLEIYEKAYTWPNGFHANADYKRMGYTALSETTGAWETTSVFYTMEGEGAFTAAVNEMLLQSWGGRLRVFPAIPDDWPEVSFKNLRAEGALLVSAEWRGGHVARLSIHAEKGGEVKLVWPLGPLAPGEKWEEKIISFQPGETKEITVP